MTTDRGRGFSFLGGSKESARVDHRVPVAVHTIRKALLSLLQRDVDLVPSTDYPYGRVIVRESKTESGQRVLPILPALLPEIHRWYRYLDELGFRSPNLPFLITNKRKPMPRAYVRALVVKRVAGRGNVRAVECTCGTSRDDQHAERCPRTKNGARKSDVCQKPCEKPLEAPCVVKVSPSTQSPKLSGIPTLP